MALKILITGGSSGIGLALAREALFAGHKVFATSRSVDKARTKSPDVERSGGEWFQLDVTDPDTAKKVSTLVETRNINVIVNAAGYAALGAFEDFSDEQIIDQFNTNVFGLTRVCQGAIPYFRERRSGIIMNIGSGAGIRGVQTRSIYCGSKFAVAGITESLQVELKPFDIKVILAELGAFETSFGDGVVWAERETTDYASTNTGELMRLMKSGAITAKGAGRPELAARRIVEAIQGEGMGAEIDDDARLILGSDCLQRTSEKISELEATVKRNKTIAPSTDGSKD